MKFEEEMAELKTLTQKLEQGNLPLEEAVALYNQGVQLATSCQKELENARLNVQIKTVEEDKANANLSNNTDCKD